MTETAQALPDPKTLSLDQLAGFRCALCNARLHADRLLGTVDVSYGGRVETEELWACAPACPKPRPRASTPRKRKPSEEASPPAGAP